MTIYRRQIVNDTKLHPFFNLPYHVLQKLFFIVFRNWMVHDTLSSQPQPLFFRYQNLLTACSNAADSNAALDLLDKFRTLGAFVWKFRNVPHMRVDKHFCSETSDFCYMMLWFSNFKKIVQMLFHKRQGKLLCGILWQICVTTKKHQFLRPWARQHHAQRLHQCPGAQQSSIRGWRQKWSEQWSTSMVGK